MSKIISLITQSRELIMINSVKISGYVEMLYDILVRRNQVLVNKVNKFRTIVTNYVRNLPNISSNEHDIDQSYALFLHEYEPVVLLADAMELVSTTTITDADLMGAGTSLLYNNVIEKAAILANAAKIDDLLHELAERLCLNLMAFIDNTQNIPVLLAWFNDKPYDYFTSAILRKAYNLSNDNNKIFANLADKMINMALDSKRRLAPTSVVELICRANLVPMTKLSLPSVLSNYPGLNALSHADFAHITSVLIGVL